MDRPINRVAPKMPVGAYKSYEIQAPLATHYRQATCKEVECDAYEKGWTTTVDTATELGARQANYIRMKSGRVHTVDQTIDSSIVRFHFPPGQKCFRQHRLPIGKPELFVVRDGDWRGNPTGNRVQRRVDDWLDDFQNHQEKLKQRIERG